MPIQYDPGGQFARGFQNIAIIKDRIRQRRAREEDKRNKAEIGQSLANIAAARSGTLRKEVSEPAMEIPTSPTTPGFGVNIPRARPLSEEETAQTISTEEQNIARRDPSTFLSYGRNALSGRRSGGSRRIVTDKNNQMWSVNPNVPDDKFKLGITGKSRTTDNTEKIRREAYKGVSVNLGISEYGMMNDPEMDILARDLIDQEIEAGTSPGQIVQNVVRRIKEQIPEDELPPEGPGFLEWLTPKVKSAGKAFSEFFSKGDAQAENPPAPGAKKAPDGNWYIEKDGQFFKVE